MTTTPCPACAGQFECHTCDRADASPTPAVMPRKSTVRVPNAQPAPGITASKAYRRAVSEALARP